MRLDKRPQTIRHMFDRIAPTYDRLNAILSLSIDSWWRRTTIRRLAIQPEDHVLDIATGTGDLAACALSHTACTVVGIDLSYEMLHRAAGKLQDAVAGRQYVPVNGDALVMPFRDRFFDKAMVAFGIRNMADKERFLDEVHRILKAEGTLGILEFSLPSNPVIRSIYFMYFRRLLPTIGGIISGDPSAYRYLRDSVMTFSPPAELESLMQRRGFAIEHSSSLLCGIAHLYILRKSSG
jgi:demethylmenaquinone methyltransferase/2-methoxy-6-polyprenyl-1,4-benzoquinol methylase